MNDDFDMGFLELKGFKMKYKHINENSVKMNKFYVGSNSVFERNWGHRTIDGAITHAQALIETPFKEVDEVFVVKIVKVVRRKSAPIEVVDIK